MQEAVLTVFIFSDNKIDRQFSDDLFLQLLAGFEPATYALRMRRATSCAIEASFQKVLWKPLYPKHFFVTYPGIEPGFPP